MNALDQAIGGQYGQYPVNPSIETVLLQAAQRPSYPDGDWVLRLETQATPTVLPTGTGGAPQVGLPAITLKFFNGNPFVPVATFTGSMSAINLITEVRSGSDNWGPGLSSTSATLNVTRTQANPDAALVAAQSSAAILPYAKANLEFYNDDIFVQFVSLPPINIGGLAVTLCGACTRMSGDSRYTEYFNVA